MSSAAVAPLPTPSPAAATDAADAASAAGKTKIAVIYYSMYGHIATLAKTVAKGAEAAGAEVSLFQVAETLSADVLAKMHAPEKDASVPVLDPRDLEKFDGLLIGMPTRYGSMPAQMRAMFDSTAALWQRNALVGKTAGTFFSTSCQSAGQETTALTSLTTFAHLGMIYIPIGFANPALFEMDEVHGGSAYGAGTLAGPKGDRQPTALELGVAEYQGKYHATATMAFKIGRAALAKSEQSA